MLQQGSFDGVAPSSSITRRSLLAGSLGLAGTILLASCSSNGGLAKPNGASTGGAKLEAAQLAVSWFGADDRTAKTLSALKLYSEKHPEITFSPTYGGYVGYESKVSTELAGGNGPDFWQLANPAALIANKRLLQLDPFVTAGALDLSGATVTTIDAQRVNGKLYSLPWGLAAPCYFYDQKVLGDAKIPVPKNGWTWDEYREIAKAITESSPKGYYGSEDIWAPVGTGAWAPFQFLLLSRGIQPYSPNGRLNFKADVLKEWFSFWLGMLKAGFVPPAEVTAEENAYATSPFVTGKAAMYPLNSSIASSLQALVKHPLGVVTMPTARESKKYLPGNSFGQYLGGIYIGVNAETRYKDDAIDVINFLLNDPKAIEAQLMSRGVPLTSEATKIVAPYMLPVEKQMMATVAYAQSNATNHVAPPAADGQVATLFSNAHQAVAFGKQSVAEAAADFMSQAATALASNS